jgi:hypothetical protein
MRLRQSHVSHLDARISTLASRRSHLDARLASIGCDAGQASECQIRPSAVWVLPIPRPNLYFPGIV